MRLTTTKYSLLLEKWFLFSSKKIQVRATTNKSDLGQVAWKLRLVESLLNLVVDKLDEGIVLFGQLLLQDPIVLFANIVGAFLKEIKKQDKIHVLELK